MTHDYFGLSFTFTGKQLAEEWNRHEVGFVAEVDCAGAGKTFCDFEDIRGFPTLKYGDPSRLEEYSGGRSYDDLAEFAKNNLTPLCSPKNLHLCDADKQKMIDQYFKMSKEELTLLIKAEEDKLTDAEEKFEELVQALQHRYQELTEEKDDAIAAVKEGGLALMKSVKKAKDMAGKGDEL
jgi:hypothetical protein